MQPRKIHIMITSGNINKMDKCQFTIEILDLYCINGDKDDLDDRCLHGDVYVKIGDEVVTESYPCTVSSTALYLLKSIEVDHIPKESANQVLQFGIRTI